MGRESFSTELATVSMAQLIELAADEDRAYWARRDALLNSGHDSGLGFGDADLHHWVRRPAWTPEQIAALSLGKDPEIVNWEACLPSAAHFPFCREFVKRCVLAWQWEEAGQLSYPVSPIQAVEWMNSVRLSYPATLQEALKFLGVEPVHWRAAYDDLLARLEHLRTLHIATLDSHSSVLRDRDKQIEEWAAWGEGLQEAVTLQDGWVQSLEQANAQLRQAIETQSREANDDILEERERGTYEKIMLAFAIDSLGYDPGAHRSPIPAELAEMTVRQNMTVTSETISRRLREAAERHWEPVE